MSTLMQLHRFYVPVQGFYQLYGVNLASVLPRQPGIRTAKAYISRYRTSNIATPPQIFPITKVYKEM